MAPLIALIAATLLARLVGAFGVAYVGTWPQALAVGLAAMFLLTASSHVVEPRRTGLVAIVPPGIPRPGLMVTATGVLEVLGAVGLLVPPVRAAAAFCLAALLVVLFPANVYAARARRHPAAPQTPLVPRTVLQLVFIAAAIIVGVTAL